MTVLVRMVAHVILGPFMEPAKVAQPTPVARRTRAGRRACAAIENVN